MLALSVLVDGILKARVATDGLHVLTVYVSGSKASDEIATVELHGGSHPESGNATFLIWLSEALHPAQCVRVEVATEGANSHPGKTVEDWFSELPGEERESVPSCEQLTHDAGPHGHHRDRLALVVHSSSGTHVSTEVKPDEHGFSASFDWNWVKPERVSASLSTYTPDQLLSKKGSNRHFKELLRPGEWAEIRIDSWTKPLAAVR